MGLLQRVTDPQSYKLESSLEQEILRICQDLNTKEEGLDLGTLFFNKLCTLFSIDQGAFFLKRQNSQWFNCIVVKNFDLTSSNKLRLDSYGANQLFKESKGVYKTSNVNFIKPYLSRREFGLLDTIILAPLFYKDELFGLYLFSDWRNFSILDNFSNLDRVINDLSFKIYSSHKNFLNTPLEENHSFLENKKLIIDIFSEAKEEDDLFLLIDISDFLKSLDRDITNKINQNFKQELFSFFKLISGRSSEIFQISNSKVLMKLDKHRFPNKDLYIYQLNYMLPQFYKALDHKTNLKVDEIAIDMHDNFDFWERILN